MVIPVNYFFSLFIDPEFPKCNFIFLHLSIQTLKNWEAHKTVLHQKTCIDHSGLSGNSRMKGDGWPTLL